MTAFKACGTFPSFKDELIHHWLDSTTYYLSDVLSNLDGHGSNTQVTTLIALQSLSNSLRFTNWLTSQIAKSVYASSAAIRYNSSPT